MELQIKPYERNLYPIGGLLLKGDSIAYWITEIQRMELSLHAMAVYPVPGKVANTLWGCLIVCNEDIATLDAGRHAWCQVAHDLFYIPQFSVLYPVLSNTEVEKLLRGKRHLMHPECGLVELPDPIDWKTVIGLPDPLPCTVLSPVATPFIPAVVKTFHIKPAPPEDVLQQMEEAHFPKTERFKDGPLNPLEKARLFIYRQLFRKGENGDEKNAIEKTSLLSKLESLRHLFKNDDERWTRDLQTDFETLERRNQKYLDRLMDLLKNNPSEALKYALPLDPEGTSRGGAAGGFLLEKRWFDFSLFGRDQFTGGSGGAAVLPDDTFQRLQQQYLATALELIKQKDYRKAAFVYMKLLKQYQKAAETLEEGGLYQEAASVYLKYCKNKEKAAACYEKGRMMADAIAIYEELGNHEKAGDLYGGMGRREEAMACYQKVVNGYLEGQHYVKAALLYRNKMGQHSAAQELLLKGWQHNKDSFNCLNNYFVSIEDPNQARQALQTIYQRDVTGDNSLVFLQVLQHEYKRRPELAGCVRDLAYEVIAAQVTVNPDIVSELRAFNREDTQLMKDTLRYKVHFRRR